jgi:hypothetical protein
MEFVNNLLIGLSAGLLAVALGEGSDTAKIAHRARWEQGLAGGATILLGLSLLTGVIVAANRLQVTRLTARQARLRNLRDRVFDPLGTLVGASWEKERLQDLVAGLTSFEHWTRPAIRKASSICLPSTNLTRANVMRLSKELRQWSSQADRRTWIGLRLQQSLFAVGAISFGIVPLWNYISRA